jgi:hypothetical protein
MENVKKRTQIKLGAIFNNYQIDFYLCIATVFFFLVLLQMWVLTFYYGISANERLTWIAQDGNWAGENWGNNLATGKHFFSDLLALRELKIIENSYTHPYPPFPVLLSKMLFWLPYKINLYIYLVMFLIALVYPIYSATKHLDFYRRLNFTVIFGLMSIATISGLDRANMECIIPLILFLFYKNRDINPSRSAIYLGLAIGLKITPIVFFLFYLFHRSRYKQIIIASITAITINVLSAQIMGASNLILLLNKILTQNQTIQSNYIGIGPIPSNISGYQLITNTAYTINIQENSLVNYFLVNPRYAVLLIFLLLITGYTIASNETKFLYPLYGMQLLTLISWNYHKTWGIVACAILIELGKKRAERVFDRLVWWLIIIFTTTPLVFYAPNTINLFPTLSFVLLLILIITNLVVFIRGSQTKGSLK